MRNVLLALTCLGLAACSAVETSRRAPMQTELPAMKTFPRSAPSAPQRSNATLARDFLDLAFTLENGEDMPIFTRFEGPVTLRVTGKAPPSLNADLGRLLGRLRTEARIDIRRVPADRPASITVVPVPRAEIRRVAPSAACFVRPNVSGWAEYRKRRHDPATYWNRLSSRERMAIFLPSDVSPQEVRDCLHEEISQALGPVNDIYRLTDSVFNDDNFHTVLTGFDMLMLRVYYDGAFRNGMSRAEVAARLPGVLARINPAGGRGGIAPPHPSDEAWQAAIETATAPRTSRKRRIASAARAIDLARGWGRRDPRLAYSHYVYGRLSLSENPDAALRAFLQAGRIYQSRPDTAVQEAHVAMQLAAFQLSMGRADVAIGLVDQNLAVVSRTEHAALLSLMLLVKAEALMLQDKAGAASEVQGDALAWARYGFGSKDEILDRAAEIVSISPRSRERTDL